MLAHVFGTGYNPFCADSNLNLGIIAMAAGRLADANGDSGIGEVMRRAKMGSRDDLGELLQSFRQYLLLVANDELGRELSAKVGASDLVQETLVAAQRDFCNFRGANAAQLMAWLKQILHNQLACTRRRFRAAKRHAQREVSLDDSHQRRLHHRLAAAQGTPSSIVARDEELQIILQALERLPDQYARVIKLRTQERKKFAEIAEQLEVSEEVARQTWARAIKRLRKAREEIAGEFDNSR